MKKRDASLLVRSHVVVLGLAFLSFFIALPDKAQAATKDWSCTAATTAWATGSNWVGGVAPTNDLTTDIARFNCTSYTSQPNAGTTSIAGIVIGDGATATAALTISGTALSIGASGVVKNAASGTATISTATTLGAALPFTNNSATLLTVGAGAITNGANLLTVNGSGNVTITGVIGNGAGGVTMSGTGTLTLQGANTYSGVTTLNAGTLKATTSASALGAGTLTLAGGTLQLANAATLSFGRNTTVTANSAIISDKLAAGAGVTFTLGTLSIGANTLTISAGTNATSGTAGITFGAVTLTGAATINSATAASGSSAVSLVTLSGGVTNGGFLLTLGGAGNTTSSLVAISGAGGVTKNDAGTLTYSIAETYTGATTINGGTVLANATNAIGSSSAVTVASGATLDLRFADTIGSLAGAGTVTKGAVGAITLTVGGDNTSTTFSGVIQNGSGTLAVTKTGTGNQTFSGANTYSGTTTVSAGTLTAANTQALGTGTLTLSGGTLDLATDTSINAYNTTVSLTSTIISDRATAGAAVTHTLGTLTISANQTLNLTLGGNVTSGTAGLTFGTTTLSNVGVVFNTAASTNLTLGALTGNFSFSKQNSGQLTLNTASARTSGAVTLSGGTTVLGDPSALGTTGVTLTLSGGTLDLATDSSVNAYNTTLSAGTTNGIVSDRATAGAAITHTLGTLSTNNAQLNVTVGGNVTSGTAGLTFGTTTLVAATPIFDTAANTNLTLGAVGGNVAFTKQNSGQLTLNTASTRTLAAGTTTLTAGTLKLGTGNALNTVASSLNLNGGTLVLAVDANTTFNGTNVVAGGGTVQVNRATAGAGVTDTLGTLSIGNVQLNVTVGGNVTSGTAGLTFGATTLSAATPIFDTASSTNLTLGALSGNFAFTKQNSGQLTLNTASARTLGAVTLAGGTTVLGASTALGSAAVPLTLSGGTLDLAINGSVSSHNTTVTADTTIISDRATAGAGVTHALGGLTIGAQTLTISAGANVTSGTAGVSFGASLGTTLTGAATFISASSSPAVSLLTVRGGNAGANTMTFDGAGDSTVWITGFSGTGGLVKNGSGTLTLSINNSYSGTTTINAGTVTENIAGGALAGAVTIAGGTLDMAAISDTVGAVTLTSGSITGTTGVLTGSSYTVESGTISAILGGGGITLTKNTAGTVTLSGANTYTGTTTVNAGTLVATTSASALGTGSLTLAGGTLQLVDDAGLAFNRNTTVTTTSTIISDRATPGAGVTHTLGTLSIGNFQLNVTAGGNVTSGTAGLTFGNTTLSAATPIFDTASSTNLTLGALSGNFAFTKQNSGQLTLNTASGRSSGTVTLAGGTTVLGNASALGTTGVPLTLSGGTLDWAIDTSGNAYNTTVTADSAIVSDRATTGAGVTHTLGTLSIGAQLTISAGATNVTSGTAGITFGATTLTGPATINSASSSPASLLTLGAVTNGANLFTFTGAGDSTVAGVLGNGSGGVTKNGTGTLTLSAANTYTGVTTINNGVVAAGNAAALGATGSGTVVNGGTLDLNGQAVGAEPVTLNGTGFASGGAVINGSGTAASLSGAVTLGSASSLGGTGDMTLSGGITGGAFTLTKTGSGTTTLSGTVGVGALVLNGGTLAGGSSALTVAGNVSGSGGMSFTTGTLTIGGDNTASGPFAAGTGTVIYSNAGAHTVRGMTYHHLTVTGGGTFSLNVITTVGGDFTIGASTIFQTASVPMSVGGNWANNGTFTAGTGMVTLNGTALQTLSGALTGTSAFYDLTITNTSGADPSVCVGPGPDPTFTPGVTFSVAAKTTNTFAISGGNVRVQYLAGATYAFTNVNWSVPSTSNKITFRSSTLGTPWLLNVPGLQLAAFYVDVKDSNNVIPPSANPIGVLNGTDCGNNTNWTFGTSTNWTATNPSVLGFDLTSDTNPAVPSSMEITGSVLQLKDQSPSSPAFSTSYVEAVTVPFGAGLMIVRWDKVVIELLGADFGVVKVGYEFSTNGGGSWTCVDCDPTNAAAPERFPTNATINLGEILPLGGTPGSNLIKFHIYMKSDTGSARSHTVGSLSLSFNQTLAVTSTNPSSQLQGVTQVVQIIGQNFLSGAIPTIGNTGSGVLVTGVSYSSQNRLDATVAVSSVASVGARDVVVTNPGGSAVCSNCFSVTFNPNAPPVVTAITPDHRTQGETAQTVTIDGGNFIDGSSLSFSTTAITVDSVTINPACISGSPCTSFTAVISIAQNALPGSYYVTVTAPGGASGTSDSPLFTIDAGPQVTSVVPASGTPGTTIPAVINGANFESGATASFGAGVTNNCAYTSAVLLTCTTVQIGAAALPGTRDVTVTNPTGGTIRGSGTKTAGFLVSTTPNPVSVTPPLLGPGATGQSLTVNSPTATFASGATVTFGKPTVDLFNLCSNFTFASPASIGCVLPQELAATGSTKALYHFDAGSGSTAADSSGSGNTGTISTTTRLYLHEASDTAAGLPDGEQSTDTANVNWTAANTIRQMTETIGSAQQSPSANTLAQTAQQLHFIRMWTSPPLAAQTIPNTTTWTLNFARLENNGSANFLARVHLYVWRPGTATKVGTIIAPTTWGTTGCNPATTPATCSENSSSSAEQSYHWTAIAGGNVTVQEGDRLVLEWWGDLTQGSATTYSLKGYYDGAAVTTATNTTVTSQASFLEASQPFALSSAWTAMGKYSPALTFDGNSDYVNVPDSATLSLTGNFSLEAWIRTNLNTVQQGIIEKFDAAGTNGYALRLTAAGKLQAVTYGAASSATVTGATTVTSGAWHHVAAVYNGATIKVYLDGAEDGSAAAAVNPTNGTNSLRIGAGGGTAGGFYFNGIIDELAIFNAALPATGAGSVQEHYLDGVRAIQLLGSAPYTTAPQTATSAAFGSGYSIQSWNTLQVTSSGTNDGPTTIKIAYSKDGGASFVSSSGGAAFSDGGTTVTGGVQVISLCNTATCVNASDATQNRIKVQVTEASGTGANRPYDVNQMKLSWTPTTGITIVSPFTTNGAGTGVSFAVNVANNLAQAVPTTFDVTVTNPDTAAGTCVDCFMVAESLSFSPSSLGQGAQNRSVTITGSGFQPGLAVDFGDANITNNCVYSSSTQITCSAVNVGGAATTGVKTVNVTSGGNVIGTGLFTVNPHPATLSLTPASALANTSNLLVTLNGANFQSGATVTFSDSLITQHGSSNYQTIPTTFVSSSQLTASIDIGAATTGYRAVVVTNTAGDGGVGQGAYFYVGALSTTGGMVAYGVSGSADPKFRLLQSDGNWTSEMGIGSYSGEPRWTVLRSNPLSLEKALAIVDTNRALTLLMWGGSGWSAPVTATASSGPTIYAARSVDLAYESVSGRALAVYGVTGSALPRYRIWDGTAWSAEASVSSTLSTGGAPTWVRLVSRPGTNEIVLVYQDTGGGIDALVWNGSAFGNEQVLTTTAPNSPNVQLADAAAEQLACGAACRVLVVWTGQSQATPVSRVWNGSWGVQQGVPISFSSSLGSLRSVRLAADPASQDIALGVTATGGQLSLSFWHSAAWATSGTAAPQTVATILPSSLVSQGRPFDLTWQGAYSGIPSRLYVVYGDVAPMARNWTGVAGWSAETNMVSTSALLGQYHMDETSNPLLDSSGNGKDLTLTTTSMTGQPGIAGQSVVFGSGVSASASNTSALGVSGAVLTMSAWVYPNSFPSQAIILNKESSYGMGINGGQLQAEIMTNPGSGCSWSWVGSTALTLNVWQHVAVTYDGSNIKFYVNGLLTQTISKTGTICTSANAFMIGARPAGSNFIGRIDEVRILNAAMTPPAMLQLAADQRGSLNLWVGQLNEAPALQTILGSGAAWSAPVSIAAPASGAQFVSPNTVYPESSMLAMAAGTGAPILAIFGASPGSAYQGQTLDVTVSGANFVCPAGPLSCDMTSNPTTATQITSFGDPNITIASGTVHTDTQTIVVTITIGAPASVGFDNITAVNPDATSATGANLFQVLSILSVVSTTCGTVTDCVLGQGAQNQTVTISGNGFHDFSVTDTEARFCTSSVPCGSPSSPDITLGARTVLSGSITYNSSLSVAPTAAVGNWNVTIINTSASVGTVTGAAIFTIVAGPTVMTAIPSQFVTGTSGTVVLLGSNFQTGATADFGAGVTVTTPCTVGSSTQMSCGITVSAVAAAGARTVTIINPSPPTGNAGQGSTAGLFTLIGPPVLTDTACGSVTPTPCEVGQGATKTITIDGSQFTATPTVTFTKTASTGSVTVNSVTFVSSTQLSVSVTVSANATVGLWDATVTSPTGGSVTSNTDPKRLSVAAGPPTVTSTSCPSGTPCAKSSSATVTINGTNFSNGGGAPTVCFSGVGMPACPITATYVNSTQLTVTIDDTGAAVGAHDVTVTLANGGTATGAGLFVLSGTPTITSVVAATSATNTAAQGLVNELITINGANFVSAPTVSFSGDGITPVSPITATFVNATQVTVTITIAATATIGARTVTVTNPDGSTVTGPSTLTITDPGSYAAFCPGGNVTVTGSTTLTFAAPGPAYVCNNVTVNGGGVLTIENGVTLAVNTLLTVGGATAGTVSIAFQSASTTDYGRINANNITVNSNGVISADGLGCPGSQSAQDAGGCADLRTTGQDTNSLYREGGDSGGTGGGGAHGGAGGDGDTANSGGKQTYGNALAPVLLGSGGGLYSGTGGNGGGAIRLDLGGGLTINGQISAKGARSSFQGGGSGGSIYITMVGTLTGTGTIAADGAGQGGSGRGGGGGGGRVALYYSNFGTMPTVTAAGGDNLGGNAPGAAGTVTLVIVDNQPPAPISPLKLVPLSVTSVSAKLQWTATGNNGALGTATVYDLRYVVGAAAVMSDTSYQTAFQVGGVPAPAVSGTVQSFTVTGLTPATNYCFAIKASDAAGNIGALDVTGTYSIDGTDGTTSTACFTTQAPDTTPPAAVSDLATALVTSGGYTYTDRVKLTWTAVGDDNNSGTATSYELRYSTSPINAGNFASAVLVSGVPAPSIAGTYPEPAPSGFIMTGLQSGLTYYFAIKVKDEVPNTSPLSNVPSQPIPLDTTPPAAITTLALGTVTASSIDLTFTSPGDDGSPAPCPCGTPVSYIVKYSTTAIGDQTAFNAAATFGGSLVPLAAGQSQSVTVGGLTPATTYYFAVEAVDEKGNQGGLSNIPVTATTLTVLDTIPPGAITDLQVVAVTDRTVQLQWTAKGNDGDAVGTALAYDLRWSHKPIKDPADPTWNAQTDTAFDSATPVTPAPPLPGPPGSGQSMTVTLESVQFMTSNTAYYFAIKAIDGGGNRSTLVDSNNHTVTGVLTNSNVDGSCAVPYCSARTAQRIQWDLVSVPLQGPLSPTTIFGPIDGQTDPCGAGDLPCLYSWLSTGLTAADGSYQLMDPCPSNCVTAGQGYFFYTLSLVPLTASGTVVAGDSPDAHLGVTHFHLPLQQGWNIIGNPFQGTSSNGDVLLSSTSVRKIGATCSPSTSDTVYPFATAVDPNGIPNDGDEWVGNAIYVLTAGDGATFNAAAYNDTTPAVLEPWQSYWFQVLKNDCSYELLIPKPN